MKVYVSDNEQLSVRQQCDRLDLNRSSVYYQAVGESDENFRIMRLMDVEFHAQPTHCVLQMQDCNSEPRETRIINSDQGSRYTGALWAKNVEKEANITISLDGRGLETDTVFIERLWRTVKQDYVYICLANDGSELYQGLKKFFEYYTNVKTHQGIERRIPASLYVPAP